MKTGQRGFLSAIRISFLVQRNGLAQKGMVFRAKDIAF